jgi:hypothetical protein
MINTRGRRGFWALALAILAVSAGFAQTPEPQGPADRYTLQMAIFGPGDELYSWWGHIGLIVTDNYSGESLLYDWGRFSFDNEDFVANFAMGRLLFSAGVFWSRDTIRSYIYQDRSVTLYTLDFSQAAMAEIARFAEIAVRPENRNYFYHHFNDNCATRIRDILDTASGGALKDVLPAQASGFTYRQAIRRYTGDTFWPGWFLSFLLGRDQDRPISEWELLFLPGELGRLEGFAYTDEAGQRHTLVSDPQEWYLAQDRTPLAPPLPNANRHLVGGRDTATAAAYGLGMALILGLLRRGAGRAGQKTAGKTGKKTGGTATEGSGGWGLAVGLIQGVWGLLLGLLGSILFFMSFFTNHDYTYHNNNLLFIHPLLLAALPLGLIVGIRGMKKKKPPLSIVTPDAASPPDDNSTDSPLPEATKQAGGNPPQRKLPGQKAEWLLGGLWTLVLAGGLLAMGANLFPALRQGNADSLLLVLPSAVVLSFVPNFIKRAF